MINPEFLPDAVQWSEGMLLSPQHFQQNDIHAQALLHQRLAGLSPYAWGVRHLRLDAARLTDGLVKITECDAVMPDGLPLVFRATHAGRSLDLDIDPKCTADGRPVRVCLAIPPRAGALDVPSTSIRRYESVQGRETLDEVIGTGDVVVERQRARLELFADHEVPAGYPSLPLFDALRSPNGVIVLGDFNPPMFRIGASAFLGEHSLQQRLFALRNAMWDKLRELIGVGGEDAPESIAALGAEARLHLRVAREVAACLPLMDTVLADPLASPAQAWWAMAQIVGRMSSVGSDPRPLAMDPYRHDDCQPQFNAALAFVARKLALIRTDWDSAAFERIADGVFARRLPDDSAEPVLIELRGGEGRTAQDLHTWLGEARIASEELLPTLRQRRMPGAQIRALGPHEISRLGLRADALIFALSSQRLETAHGFIDSFRAGRTLVVQGAAAQGPSAIVLHHRRGGAARAPAGTGGGAHA